MLCTHSVSYCCAGNKPHPSVSHEKYHFGKDDPRAALALPSVDPRIHFALVCGAKVTTPPCNVLFNVLSCQQSCPAIQVYTADNMDTALEAAAKSFISQEVEVNGNQVSSFLL